jgi:hypothetical protein
MAIPEAVWFAAAGALGTKLLELAERPNMRRADRPDLRDFWYWFAVLIMPLLGGGLAYMYLRSGVQLTPVLAVNVGISTPLILRTMGAINPIRNPSGD